MTNTIINFPTVDKQPTLKDYMKQITVGGEKLIIHSPTTDSFLVILTSDGLVLDINDGEYIGEKEWGDFTYNKVKELEINIKK